jgi:hypothetical protein
VEGVTHSPGMLTFLWGVTHESGFDMTYGVESLDLKTVYVSCLFSLWN